MNKNLLIIIALFLGVVPVATGVDGGLKVKRLRPCLLTVLSQPWGQVFLNGKSYGYTPLMNVEIPSGYQNLVWRDYKGREWRRSLTAYDNGIYVIQIKK